MVVLVDRQPNFFVKERRFRRLFKEFVHELIAEEPRVKIKEPTTEKWKRDRSGRRLSKSVQDLGYTLANDAEMVGSFLIGEACR
jgi:hypothetical protein